MTRVQCFWRVIPSVSVVAPILTSTNVPSLHQQSLPLHAYPTQPCSVHHSPYTNILSYHQYMPPGFSYLQNHYQQNIGNTLKYSLPQYKQSASVDVGVRNTVMPGATGYGDNAGSQQGYPAASVTNFPNVDEVLTHYKDGSLYIPTQQVDTSFSWLQAPLSQEVLGGSFYNNVCAQNQQRYPQPQHMNAHAHSIPGALAFSSLYQPQQSGPTVSVPQLRQAFGSVSVPGMQIGSYQQGQRGQQSWANGF